LRRGGPSQRRARRSSAPVDDQDRFEALWQQQLAPQLAGMESDRRRTRNRILGWSLLILLVGTPLVVYLQRAGFGEPLVPLSAIAVLLGVIGTSAWYYLEFRARFKDDMVAPMVRAFDPGLSYQPRGAIAHEEFLASGLFREYPVNEYGGEDLISGRIGATTIRFSEVQAYYTPQGPVRRGRKHARKLFDGLFFIADFNKHFQGSTYVLPDRAQRLLGGLGQSLQGLTSTYGQLVKLEDPEFERLFVVYSSDQIEARYILSASLMARISAFRIKSGQALRLGFVDSKLYAAIDLRRNLFEPRLFRSLADRALYREFWDDLELLTGIVDDLNLNTRIWSKR
jgi:hypothetical protein